VDFLVALRAEELRLSDELKGSPPYQKLEAVQRAIAIYAGGADGGTLTQNNATPKTSGPKNGTTTAAVLDAAEGFLTQLARRAQTPEIAGELRRRGIIPSLEGNVVRGVASYLSTAKDRFDNVRGEGYGLVRWSEIEREVAAEFPEPEDESLPHQEDGSDDL
jgi:hypothetical protein